MQMTFRWFGPNDPVPLAHVRQIPGVRGDVSALYDVPVATCGRVTGSRAWPIPSTPRASSSPRCSPLTGT